MKTAVDDPTTSALPSDDLFDIDEFACMTIGKKLSGYRCTSAAHEIPEGEKAKHFALKLAILSVAAAMSNRRAAKTMKEAVTSLTTTLRFM
jgi:hypothetical protein